MRPPPTTTSFATRTISRATPVPGIACTVGTSVYSAQPLDDYELGTRIPGSHRRGAAVHDRLKVRREVSPATRNRLSLKTGQ